MTTTQTHDSTTCTAGINGAKCEMCQFAQHLDEVSAIVKTWEPWERHIFGGVCGVDDCPCHEFALKSPSEASSGAGVAQDVETVKTASTTSSGSGIAIPAPAFTHEWSAAPAHLKPVFHPSLIRAAVFDVIDGGCNCGTSTDARHPWKFDDEIEDFANEQRVRFADAVIARLLEIRRISNECDPSSNLDALMDQINGMLAHYQIGDWEAYVFFRKRDCPDSYVLKYEAAAGDEFAQQIVNMHRGTAAPERNEGDG